MICCLCHETSDPCTEATEACYWSENRDEGERAATLKKEGDEDVTCQVALSLVSPSVSLNYPPPPPPPLQPLSLSGKLEKANNSSLFSLCHMQCRAHIDKKLPD